MIANFLVGLIGTLTFVYLFGRSMDAKSTRRCVAWVLLGIAILYAAIAIVFIREGANPL